MVCFTKMGLKLFGRINSSDLGSEAIKAFLVDSSIMKASL